MCLAVVIRFALAIASSGDDVPVGGEEACWQMPALHGGQMPAMAARCRRWRPDVGGGGQMPSVAARCRRQRPDDGGCDQLTALAAICRQ